MATVMALLRLFHVFAGVVWVGTAFFFALFLEPALQGAGPEGGKFMQRLTQTGLALKFSIASSVVVVSGVIMYWVASRGLAVAWIGSVSGIILTLGSLAGIAAFTLGLIVQGPANARIAALQKEIQTAGSPNPTQLAEIAGLQKKISDGARWGAPLMALALIGMVVG